MVVVGLDLSLVSSGYAIVRDDGTVLASGIVKSKPVGPLPVDEARRLKKIAEDLLEKVDEILPTEDPTLVVVENLAFGVRNATALTQLAGLSYLLRILMDEFKWPFLMIFPTSLKKFIAGTGKADKNVLMLEVYKQYGHSFIQDDENDAFCLAACGLAVLGKPLKALTVPQKEVINLLKKQLS